jgi:O-methyltransferase
MGRDAEATSKNPDALQQLYLDLLKKCLCRCLPGSYEPIEPFVKWFRAHNRFAYWVIKKPLLKRGLELARPVDLSQLEEGKGWPRGETMIGLRRLDNLQSCIASVISRGVQGDFIEAGVWRGGAAIFMRAALEAFGDTQRRVWVADSFQGPPKPDTDKYPADEAGLPPSDKRTRARASLDSVKNNFEFYGMLDDRVIFLPGWFRDTLPTAPIERLAIMRLDGDLYESTMDSLKHLYPKLSVGGYVIVDDYNALPAAKQATDDFREEQGITEVLTKADWSAAYWKREDR